MMEITSEELKQKIENGEKLIIDFYTDWCNPCRMMKPIFQKVSEKLRNENSEVQLYTMNAENNRDIAVNYGVRAVPTIKIFNNGDVVDTKTGVQMESQILDLVNNLING
jgi:thioredoxin 1